MPSLKELRNRITSVGATAKITKALQMVAAAQLRRAARIYASVEVDTRQLRDVRRTLHDLVFRAPEYVHLHGRVRPTGALAR